MPEENLNNKEKQQPTEKPSQEMPENKIDSGAPLTGDMQKWRRIVLDAITPRKKREVVLKPMSTSEVKPAPTVKFQKKVLIPKPLKQNDSLKKKKPFFGFFKSTKCKKAALWLIALVLWIIVFALILKAR
ncbi:hypothetical protein L6279_02850 [Candidatus Parcubacteria bacterium]|nr:hypothetical protein [Candidatus Parcubacteria bacterium]